jgi:hypothetical protein
MRSYLKEKLATPALKTEINDRRGSTALTTNTPLSAKVGTIFRQQVAVAELV